MQIQQKLILGNRLRAGRTEGRTWAAHKKFNFLLLKGSQKEFILALLNDAFEL
jgi:hypothetical protein